MRHHYLKTWPEPFEAVEDGRKRFELRFDDRGFAVGDLLILCKWDPTAKRYLRVDNALVPSEDAHHAWTELMQIDKAALITVRITYITRGGFGLSEGHVILGFKVEKEQ